MGVRRRRLTSVLLGVVALVSLLVACGDTSGTSGTSGTAPLRATLPLPVPQGAAVHGDFVTRRLALPATYASAGRQFYLHERRTAGPPQPLVLLLHGLYQSPMRVERATAATAFSEMHHFTLVFPVGENEAWNAGYCCRLDKANDVGYLVDLVRYVATLTPIDLHRVYIWGFSNGGMMAWRAVCQTSGVFAGAGVMDGALLVGCPRAVRVVDVHGLADTTVPYRGGYSRYTHTLIPSSVAGSRRLARGSLVRVVLIKDLGHEWPPLRRGSLDALGAFWNGLRDYRVDHPATAVPKVVEG